MMTSLGAAALAALLTACDQPEQQASQSAASASSASSTVELLSFEAIYELSLKKTGSGANIVSYEGLMVVNNVDACDGFTSDQRITALIADEEGNSLITEFWATSWEARDRSLFRFESKMKHNDLVTEETEGRASREAADVDGEILFQKPDVDPVTLTPEIQFPMEYAIKVIEAAHAGERIYQALLTDGTAETAVIDAVTFIGDDKIPLEEELSFEGAGLLKGLTAWPIQVGYHNPDSQDGLPDVQVTMDMFENGVATDAVWDYGDFALNLELKELKEIKGAGC